MYSSLDAHCVAASYSFSQGCIRATVSSKPKITWQLQATENIPTIARDAQVAGAAHTELMWWNGDYGHSPHICGRRATGDNLANTYDSMVRS